MNQKNPDKCPYLKDKDCGHPNKQACIDADYESCFSFRCLKECEDIKEEKKNGKVDCAVD